ncbi:TerB N-terminal domain-containing protein [Trinickia mobilis]|uniref:TerB N-terminal domain-containing protein n=1 Tax=Trinickia mobilis TaxID=2816356 RepID=UPI001A8DBF38|nr:TerB N-terminal domain-containing protein [Trinickia mobilis]
MLVLPGEFTTVLVGALRRIRPSYHSSNEDWKALKPGMRMAQKRKSKSALPLVGAIIFSLWLIGAHPGDITLLFVALMFFALLGYYLAGTKESSAEAPASTKPPPRQERVAHARQSPGKRKPADNVPAVPSNAPKVRKPPDRTEMVTDEFATIEPDEAPATGFTIRVQLGTSPKRSSTAVTDCWVPKNVAVKARRYTILNGLFYFGEGLEAAHSGGTEPSLVDESLPIGRDDDYTDRKLSYYPSYGSASPDARASYLNWLANGRRDAQADIGYVYLYFYGLERRALVDAATDPVADAEIPAICAEVEGLLSVYRGGGFAPRARNLLEFCKNAELGDHLYLDAPPAGRVDEGMRFLHTLALSQAYRHERPFPSNWLLSWYFADRRFKKPGAAARFQRHFELLFAREAEQRFSAHAWLAATATPKLRLTYRPVSPGLLPVGHFVATKQDMVDVTSAEAGLDSLVEDIGQTVAGSLDTFVRYVGRNPEKADTPEAEMLLPCTLWPEAIRERFEKIVETLRTNGSVSEPIPLALLLAPRELPAKFERASYLQIVTRVAHGFQLGIEPDPRFGSPLPTGETTAVFFQVPPDGPFEASEAYARRAATVGFYADIIRADGTALERACVKAFELVNSWTELSESERTRLHALLVVLLNSSQSAGSTKKRLQLLGDTDKRQVAGELIEICQAAGGLTKVTNIHVLEKLFAALGQETQGLYSLAHSAAAAQSSEYANTSGLGVPPNGKAVGMSENESGKSDFSLDLDRLAKLRRETAEVSAVLGAIFKDEAPETSSSAELAPATPATVDIRVAQEQTTPQLLGLNDKHWTLLRRLLARQQWARADIEPICAEIGLLLDGALERINEASFDAFDEPLLEGDDPVEINQALVGGLDL